MPEVPVEGAVLIEAMVGAFPGYVKARLAERDWDVDVDASLDQGSEWLREQLEELLAVPYGMQRRGALEVFQAAMSFPTEVLSAAGLAESERDDVSRRALPGDVFDLAPASSRDLGDDVWQLHLRWAAAKIEAVVGGTDPERRN